MLDVLTIQIGLWAALGYSFDWFFLLGLLASTRATSTSIFCDHDTKCLSQSSLGHSAQYPWLLLWRLVGAIHQVRRQRRHWWDRYCWRTPMEAQILDGEWAESKMRDDNILGIFVGLLVCSECGDTGVERHIQRVGFTIDPSARRIASKSMKVSLSNWLRNI